MGQYNLNWLDLVVIGIIGYNAFMAYKRGFIITIFRFTYLILAILLTKLFYPIVNSLLRNSTSLYDSILSSINKGLNLESLNLASSINDQIQNINSLELPGFIKSNLLENNNYEIYKLLGAEDFGDYIGAYLANISINIISMIIVFICVAILLKVAINVFDLIAKLPILNSINKIFGLVVGLAVGFIIVWIGCFIITLFYTSSSVQSIVSALESSTIAIWFYQNNLLAELFLLGVAVF